MADKAQSWVYAEDYIAENEILLEARDAANELGANPVSPGTGAALRMLAALTGARAVLEVGTGAGVSSLWLLDGMSPDGVLTTSGRALDVLPRMTDGGYDLVVLDADISQTPEYLDHAVRILRPGGTVALVHAMWNDQVCDPARRDAETVMCRELIRFLRESPDFVPCLLPVGDGLAVAVKR